MSIFLQTLRLAVPVVFFGYGLVANVAMVAERLPDVQLPQSGLLSGGLTEGLDGHYKARLPHNDMAFGVIGAARFALLGEARQGALVGPDGWLFTAEEARPIPEPRAVAAIADVVRDVQRDLAEAGAGLVVVPLPAKIDIYRDKSPDPGLGAPMAALHADFVAALAKRGIAVVDARAKLMGQGEATFLVTDTHWTPHGAALVAGAVAEAGLIEPGTLTFDRTPAEPARLTGDLVKFVTTPDFAPLIGLHPERVEQAEQVQAAAPADIFGSDGPDIVLVGTSYSANPDWGFADALMRALGRDVVSVAESGLGPLRPMQDYLATLTAGEPAPRTVIWEIPVRYLADPSLWPEVGATDQTVAGLSDREASDG